MTVESDSSVQVEQNVKSNMGFVIYLSFLTLVGVAVMYFGYRYGWGFWGWFGGSLLIFSGAGGLAGMKMTGGMGIFPCPACGKDIEIQHITESRVIACSHCHTYLEGAEVMTIVPDDRITDYPAFEVLLPESVQWPEGCPVCDEPVTHTTEIEGVSASATTASLVSPVSFERVSKLHVPCCPKHDDGVGLYRSGDDVFVTFRSHAYWRRFCELNALKK